MRSAVSTACRRRHGAAAPRSGGQHGRELGENVRARLKQQLLDGLLEANPVEVPKSLVDAQVREMQIEGPRRRMGAKDASQVPPPDPFVETRRRRVALGLLVGELIKSPRQSRLIVRGSMAA